MTQENNNQTDKDNQEEIPAASQARDIPIEDDAESGEPEMVEETSAPEAVAIEEPIETESERYIRLAAEFDNYKKRTAREFGELIKTANTRLLRHLVEIADNFERALTSNGEEGSFESYRKGVELIYNQLEDLLKRENVTAVDAVGQPFDPNVHEAMMQQASDEYDEGIIIQEVQKGYRLDDKVLRHARVIVSGGAAETDNQETNEA